MQYLYKMTWLARGLIYKIVFSKFGNFSYIGKPIFLMNTRNMTIGKKVRIFPGLRAECIDNGILQIHDNVSIGQSLHVISSNKVIIETGCLISANVFITDTDHNYEDINKPVFDQPNIVKTTLIGENCFLGIGVRIQAGTTLGKGCIIGANSVVRGHFPDHSVIVGTPGRIVKHYDYESKSWIRSGPIN